MFSRTKNLEDTIEEWRNQGANSITIVPFRRYGLKYGHLIEIASFIAYLATNPSEEDLKRYHESRKGKLEGTGRFYFPNTGKDRMEYVRSEQSLSDLNKVVESLRTNEFEVEVKEPDPPLDFVGVKPIGPTLQVV